MGIIQSQASRVPPRKRVRVPGLVPDTPINYPASMERMSNRDRIARAAEEARLTEAEKAEKAEKKAIKDTTRTRSKRAPSPVRMKVVWEVCSGTGKTVKTFPYPDKAAAEAQTKALTRSTGRAHMLRATKVPME